MGTDRIEKTIALRALRSRVWRALARADQFGAWFGVALEGAFAPGARLTGRMTTSGHEHVIMGSRSSGWNTSSCFRIAGIRTRRAEVDYADEPTTLVKFHLADSGDGARLTVVESDFERLPPARLAAAFHGNDRGWGEEVMNIAR